MAIDFDGLTSGVSLGSLSTADNTFDGGGTLTAWIQPSGWGANNRGRIWDKASGTAPVGGWIFFLSTVGNYLSFAHNFSTTLGAWSSPNNSIVIGTLYHVAVTYNNGSTANNPIFYINGQSVTITEVTTPSGTRTDESAEFLILATNNIVTRSFDGVIDDPRVYNRILSPGEIQTIYSARGRDMIVEGLVTRPCLWGRVVGTTPSDGDIKDLGPNNYYSNKVGTMPYVDGVINPGRA